MGTYTEGWACTQCDEFYLEEYDAENCCPTEIMSSYQCDECGSVWEMKSAAESCCPDYYSEPNEHDCAT